MTQHPTPRPLVNLPDVLSAIRSSGNPDTLCEAALDYVSTNYINPGAVHGLNWVLLQDPAFMMRVRQLMAERLAELIEEPPHIMEVIALIEAQLQTEPDLDDTAAVEAVLADAGKFWSPGQLLGQLVDAHIKILTPSDGADRAHRYNFNAAMSENRRRILEHEYAHAQLVANLTHIVGQRRINRAS